MSENINKLSDNDLEKVTGGENRRVANKSDDHAVIKAGPGQDFDVICSINNGDYVYTTGNSKTVAGVTWLELEGGGWINAARLE